MALNNLYCVEVPLRNCSLDSFLQILRVQRRQCSCGSIDYVH